MILKEGSTRFSDESHVPDPNLPTHLVTISAKDEVALENLCQEYKQFLNEGKPFSIADFSYSVNTTRSHHPFRLATVASSFKELIKKISSQEYSKGIVHGHSQEPITFLFTGHGCQYFGMAQSLYDKNSAFRSAFDECSEIFRNNFDITLRQFIWEDESLDMSRTKYSQPAIFCIQYCLLKLWASFGVRPDLVLGHSIGEFAACVAAGILSFEDGMRLVVSRSQLADSLPPNSRMMAVGTSETHVNELVTEFLETFSKFWIDIATVNSSSQSVISSSVEGLNAFTRFCADKAPSVKTKVLTSQHGFHSRAMDPILDEFEDIASTVKVNDPICTYVSGTLSKVLRKEDITATYWRNHLRNKVSFSDAADLVLQSGNRIFVEIGPQPVLLNFVMANNSRSETPLVTCPSIRSGQDCWETLMGSLAKLYVSGGSRDINFEGIYRGRKVTLPNYTFNRKKCWATTTTSKALAGIGNGAKEKLTHPLLGWKLNLPMSGKEWRYHNYHSISSTKYIKDHVISDHVVVPAAAYLEMILALGREIGDHKLLVAENLQVSKALYLDN